MLSNFVRGIVASFGGYKIQGNQASRKYRRLCAEGLERRDLLSGNNLFITDVPVIVGNTPAIELAEVQQNVVPAIAKAAGPSNGLSDADLQAQIDALLAQLAGAGGWSYQVTPLIDFNGDNWISAIDVLTVINRMNEMGGAFPLRPMSGNIFDLMDPDGDGKCAPMHALIAINYLNWHGSGPFIQSYTDVVFEQYVDGDSITVVPGQQHALVAQVIFTASVYNINPIFLSRVTAIGDSDMMQLQYTDPRYGQSLSNTWGSYKDLWLPDLQLDPGASIQVSLFADIRDNASGELNFGLSNLQVRAFPGEVVQTVSNANKPVIVQIPQPQATQISTYGLISGTGRLVDIGAVKWGNEQLPDKVNLTVAARGPNITGNLVTEPFSNLAFRVAHGQYINPEGRVIYSDNSTGVQVLCGLYTFDLPQAIVGQKWYIEGGIYNGNETSLLAGAEYRLYITDAATGLNIALSDWTPIVVGGGMG